MLKNNINIIEACWKVLWNVGQTFIPPIHGFTTNKCVGKCVMFRDWVISIKLPFSSARWWHHATYLFTACNNAFFESNSYNLTKYQTVNATGHHNLLNFLYDPGEFELRSFENQNSRRKSHGNDRQISDPALFHSFPLFGSYPYDFLKWMVSLYPRLVRFLLGFISAVVNFHKISLKHSTMSLVQWMGVFLFLPCF